MIFEKFLETFPDIYNFIFRNKSTNAHKKWATYSYTKKYIIKKLEKEKLEYLIEPAIKYIVKEMNL